MHAASVGIQGFCIIRTGMDITLKHAFVSQLFERDYTWLAARIRRRVGCGYNAEDIASETFIRVLSHPDPASIREPRAFLTTIARHVMHEVWRRRNLEQACIDALSEQSEHFHPSPEEQEVLVETLLVLDRLLDGLPGQGKAAFIHSRIGGLTYAQIAERLGISVSRVRQYMVEAFKLCHQALE
jgi:RNA polymerase sigma factor (sigma-70 family)